MPITSAQIEFRLSGGAANTSPTAALGGAMSTAGGGLITSGVANNLWPDVTGAQSAAGLTDFRGFYVRNNNGSGIVWQSPVIWIDVSPTGSAFDLAIAAEGVSTAMATIASGTTAPTSVTFSRPTNKAAGLALGSPNLSDGQYRGVWIRRTVTAGASAANDSGSVRAEGDSGP
jgi:hypothetical protein